MKIPSKNENIYTQPQQQQKKCRDILVPRETSWTCRLISAEEKNLNTSCSCKMGWRALYFQYLSNVLVLHSVFNLTFFPVVKTNTEASRRAGDLSRTWAFFSFPGKMSKSRGVLEIQTRKHFLGPHYGYGVSEWLATEEGCHFLLSRSLQDESVPGTTAI